MAGETDNRPENGIPSPRKVAEERKGRMWNNSLCLKND